MPLHAEMVAHELIRQLINRTRCHTPAFIENAELACYPPCERQFLFDQ